MSISYSPVGFVPPPRRSANTLTQTQHQCLPHSPQSRQGQVSPPVTTTPGAIWHPDPTLSTPPPATRTVPVTTHRCRAGRSDSRGAPRHTGGEDGGKNVWPPTCVQWHVLPVRPRSGLILALLPPRPLLGSRRGPGKVVRVPQRRCACWVCGVRVSVGGCGCPMTAAPPPLCLTAAVNTRRQHNGTYTLTTGN